VRAYDPDAIVHCAILNDHKVMYQDRMQGWNAYVNSTRYLTEAANRVRAKMILISTDWVFDGTQAPADELTPPNPINFYGVLKVVGETLLSAQCANWAVARVSAVNGVHWARPEEPMQQNIGFGNFMTSVVQTLRNNKPYTVLGGNVNLRATPTLASEIGEMVLQIIKLDLTGIFHCCGGESATRFDLACKTVEGFGLDTGMLRRGTGDVPAGDFSDVYGVPKDTRLNAEKTARQLEHPLLDLNEAIHELRRQIETLTI
jgi:dTDP-4-dehydrorhamnose reductase